MDKINAINVNLKELEQQIKNAEFSAQAALAEANSHIGAMSSRYDTFKEEAQYLNEAQSIRVAELKELYEKTVKLCNILRANTLPRDIVTAGSFVTLLDSNGEATHYLILYYGTLTKVSCYDKPTTIVSTHSPIARALVGLELGDDVEIILPQKTIHAEIICIK